MDRGHDHPAEAISDSPGIRLEIDLAGRVAVVTGASRELGRMVALALAGAGADVVVTARDADRLLETAEAISATSQSGVLAVEADVASPDDVERLRVETEKRFGPATILINVAGVFGPLAPLWETEPAEWVRTLTINTIGPYLACRAFVPGMLAAGWGRIVNVSSAASLNRPGPLNSAYSTSKAALNHMTRHLAAELDQTGVAASLIHPGSAKTEMWEGIRRQAELQGEQAAAFRAWATLVGDTGGDPPEKAARLILDLVDPRQAPRNGEFCWLEDGLETPVSSW